MAQNAQEWREETLRVDQTDLLVVKGGSGKPLLVLHEELGIRDGSSGMRLWRVIVH